MKLSMAEVYDDKGQVSPLVSSVVSGYKQNIEIMNGLSITFQEVSCKTDIEFSEFAPAAFYISLLSNKRVNTSEDFDSLQTTLLENDMSGSFVIKAGETKTLLQLQIHPQILAQALDESTTALVAYLKKLIGKLSLHRSTLTMPVTRNTISLSAPLLNVVPEKRLSLVGQVYAFAFLVLEQMQILSHMLSCTDCQSKLFNVQNLLEADFGVTKELAEFAYQAGLSVEALELGFYHLVGQTVTQYRDQARLKRAAAMLRTDSYSRSDIIATTGFSEDQLEVLFIQHFGVPIAQYGQIH